MANRIEQPQIVSLEELAISNCYEIAALVNVLERKGLLTRDEVLLELKKLRQQTTTTDVKDLEME
jgi:hypothetical protein